LFLGARRTLNAENGGFRPGQSLSVSFLSFLNGRSQLRVGNNNTDQGNLKIVDCSFERSTGAAPPSRLGPAQKLSLGPPEIFTLVNPYGK
jgi:hypothetical protein